MPVPALLSTHAGDKGVSCTFAPGRGVTPTKSTLLSMFTPDNGGVPPTVLLLLLITVLSHPLYCTDLPALLSTFTPDKLSHPLYCTDHPALLSTFTSDNGVGLLLVLLAHPLACFVQFGHF